MKQGIPALSENDVAMTRLNSADLTNPANDRERYEKRLRDRLGISLVDLAADALSVDARAAVRALAGLRVAAVPISSGQGLISGFAAMLAGIADQLGCSGRVVPPDEEGFRTARSTGANLIIWADDADFIAENLGSGIRAENGRATGLGFVAALDRLCGGLSGKTIAVTGCGPVGSSGAEALLRRSARVVLCDIRPDKAKTLAERLRPSWGSAVAICDPDDLPGLGHAIDGLLDAAPRRPEDGAPALPDRLPVSAPAVPNLWPDTRRLWHDPLQTGTAVMLLAAALDIPL